MRVLNLVSGLPLCHPETDNIKSRFGNLAGVMTLQWALFSELKRATRWRNCYNKNHLQQLRRRMT
jgi:hypothetical protein